MELNGGGLENPMYADGALDPTPAKQPESSGVSMDKDMQKVSLDMSSSDFGATGDLF